jgi:hypothetical protein
MKYFLMQFLWKGKNNNCSLFLLDAPTKEEWYYEPTPKPKRYAPENVRPGGYSSSEDSDPIIPSQPWAFGSSTRHQY